jgi:hypothetical protein
MGWRLQPSSPPHQIEIFKNTDLVDMMTSKVLRDLPFSQNQPLKSADDIRILKNTIKNLGFLFFFKVDSPSVHRPPQFWGSSITLRHITLLMTPLDEWSARRSDLYLTTHNTHKRQTSMAPAGFKPTIPASERPQFHALDRATREIVHDLSDEINKKNQDRPCNLN